MLNLDRQREILLADFARWQAREHSPFEDSRMNLHHATEDREYLKGIGFVTPKPRANGGRSFPRTHASEHTSDCVVTTAGGDVFTIKYGRSSSNRKRVNIKALQAAQNKRITAANLAPIGDSNH